ncbi:MAG TPA: hypothetical protein PLW14_07815 [Chlorobiota bacterium]|nr:hypothetical protein [Chlorobiota bacterium]
MRHIISLITLLTLHVVSSAQYDSYGRFSVIPSTTGWGTEKSVRFVREGTTATFAVVPTGADREGLALFRYSLITGESDMSFGVGGGTFAALPDSLQNFQIVGIRATEQGYIVFGTAVTRLNPSPLRAIAFGFTKTGDFEKNFGSDGVSVSAFPEIDSVYPARDIPGGGDAFLAYGISRGPEVWTLSDAGEWARGVDVSLNASTLNVVRDEQGRWLTLSVSTGDVFDVTVRRNRPDGVIDNDFGSNGQVRWTGEYSGGVVGMCARSDGSYVVVTRLGALADPTQGRIQFLVIPDDGSRIDSSMISFNGMEEQLVPNSMSVDADNRVLLAGMRFVQGRPLPFIARMLPSLQPDPIYGSRGVWTAPMDNLPAGVGEEPTPGESGTAYFLVNVSTGLGGRFVYLQEASEVRVGVAEETMIPRVTHALSDGSIDHLHILGFPDNTRFVDLVGRPQDAPLPRGCWFHEQSRRIVIVPGNR